MLMYLLLVVEGYDLLPMCEGNENLGFLNENGCL